MSINCTQCGRQYDVTLFEFGRTISCACGARVGFEHRLQLESEPEPRFFADVNVARLVRWLRAVGLDTIWEDAIDDAELVRRAFVERRYVLTLDKRLAREFRADNIVLLSSDRPLAQFAETVARFRLAKPAALFTRCLVCNTPLERPGAAAGTDELPPHVAPEQVFHCPHCRKLYWEGSHTRRMREAIEQIFAARHEKRK